MLKGNSVGHARSSLDTQSNQTHLRPRSASIYSERAESHFYKIRYGGQQDKPELYRKHTRGSWTFYAVITCPIQQSGWRVPIT